MTQKNTEKMKIKKFYSLTAVLFLILMSGILSGCASLNPFADSVAEYDLDGIHDMELILMPGEEVAFEMRNPGSSGYDFDGVTFDPKVIQLDKFRIIKSESGMLGDFGRWRFKFTTVTIGETSIVINIKRPGEDLRDAYKIIDLSVTKDGPPFIEW